MDEFQAEVTRIALSTAGSYGFALAGGGALVAQHGIVSRATEDIDLFTNVDDAVEAAVAPVEGALTAAGLNVEVIAETSELGDGLRWRP